MPATDAPTAPGELELVRAFVNTLDLEDGVDQLADPASWSAWADGLGIPEPASKAELARLRELREALRAGLLANHDRAPLPAHARQSLDEVLLWSRARPVLTDAGIALEVGGAGARALAGKVVAIVGHALADGTWSRLKACRDDTCRWAFYDRSRSRTGQWCSMEVCGNRNKQARWRERQA
ncbi:CGNR zinc finger domain-containing protein [Serinicoccus kebangsaanensis]|uniref:CGNR zinc finger domain-containing protein n=1 Tax=Serinicoccus kebangsaanensis TaxID=2602069 RepID=UPI00124C3C78|nr:CGNR zinc finger domain-containing protein [Serinicoccus kebangsaanensis]